MTKLYNIKSRTKLRQHLRNLPVLSEKKLWQRLNGKQLGYKFRRQYGIGNYVVDFCCVKLKFIIEIDGATHSTQKEIDHDIKRQVYLEEPGFTVKRYTNNDIEENMDSVLEDILRTCKKL